MRARVRTQLVEANFVRVVERIETEETISEII